MQPTAPVEAFLGQFITSRLDRSPEAIKGRLLHWVERANNPASYSPDKSPKSIQAIRRKALQNVRRTVDRYPAIAAQLSREREVTR